MNDTALPYLPQPTREGRAMSLEIAHEFPNEDIEHIDMALKFQVGIATRGGGMVSGEAWREIDQLLDIRNAVKAGLGRLAAREEMDDA